jgi:hypothetical protein
MTIDDYRNVDEAWEAKKHAYKKAGQTVHA